MLNRLSSKNLMTTVTLSLFVVLFIIALNLTFIVTAYSQVYLNYEDLVELSKTPNPLGELKQKLDNQLNTPIIVQSSESGTGFLNGMILGNFFRVASWNIERGFNADRIAEILKPATNVHTKRPAITAIIII